MRENIHELRLTIVEGRPAHASVLRDLAEHTFREAYAEDTDTTNMERYVARHFTLEQVLQDLSDAQAQYLLAMHDDEPIGYALLRRYRTHPDIDGQPALMLHRIYVRRHYWCKQVGASLLQHIIQIAQKEKFACIWLVVWDQNIRAIRFYEKYGFAHCGYELFELGDEITNDWVMQKKL